MLCRDAIRSRFSRPTRRRLCIYTVRYTITVFQTIKKNCGMVEMLASRARRRRASWLRLVFGVPWLGDNAMWMRWMADAAKKCAFRLFGFGVLDWKPVMNALANERTPQLLAFCLAVWGGVE